MSLGRRPSSKRSTTADARERPPSTLGEARGRPPTFEEAKNRRQKVRAAGMNPDYWYPAAWDHEIAKGQVVEVKFWGRSIALFRGDDGALRAVEDRCAHRQLKLSKGEVTGCTLTCTYHGWQFDGRGRCVNIPHDLFGNKMPQVQLGTYLVAVKHGIIWVFPGDPAMAAAHPIPEIPELAPGTGWGVLPIDFVLGCHHSMIIDNVSDFSHAYLHRRSRPFTDAKLKNLEAVGDSVRLSYETKVGTGRISGLFVDRNKTNTNAMDLAYEYPYQWSNTDGKIKHWLFVRPIDERTTRAFFVFYFSPDTLKVPFLPITIPPRILDTVMRVAKEVLVRPLLSEDKFAVEAEQEGYETHFDKPIAELNPCVREFQDLTIRKWEEHLARTQKRAPAAQAHDVAEAQPLAAAHDAE
jgi:phenylpropionate dioxygenase-like ring-hydroxylating dioxygenase large terminal subunit